MVKRTFDNTRTGLLLFAVMCVFSTPLAQAQSGDHSDLAKKLANPIASLISLPFQLNYDEDFGLEDEGSLWRMNVQPVIPYDYSADWNLISRTIVPVVSQEGFPTSDYSKFGLSDTVQSFFFSPKQPTDSGWTWGVGPVLLIPTATDDFLGGEKWGAGPTGVALKQHNKWTYGVLANHIESFAGETNRDDISATFIQPFLTYITPAQTTFALNTEATYDWEGEQWSVPINFNVLQLVKVGDQIMQVGGGLRYWAESPDAGAEGWGFRLNLVFVFPR